MLKQHATFMLAHTLLLAFYAFVLPFFPERTERLLQTVLGFVLVLGTSLPVVQSLLAARTAPLEHALRKNPEGRRELLWRTANHQPRLTRVGGWPSWTLQAYRYGTFGFGIAAVIIAFFYIMGNRETLTFSDVAVIVGLIALAAGLPLLVFRSIFDRWARGHLEEVDTLLSSPEAKRVQKEQRRIMSDKEKR